MGKQLGTREYEYNLVWMDCQHRGFIDWFNTLEKGCQEGMLSGVEILKISKFIEWYIRDHFSIEETYMERFNYPNYEKHKREHLKFISEYRDFFANISQKDAIEVGNELVWVMADYILINISEEDRQLAKFLKKKGAK